MMLIKLQLVVFLVLVFHLFLSWAQPAEFEGYDVQGVADYANAFWEPLNLARSPGGTIGGAPVPLLKPTLVYFDDGNSREGKVIMTFGTRNVSSPVNSRLFVYDIALDFWEEFRPDIRDITLTVTNGAAVIERNGVPCLFVFGGSTDFSLTDSVGEGAYLPLDNLSSSSVWRQVDNLSGPSNRSFPSVAVSPANSSAVYIFGGVYFVGSVPPVFRDDFYRYNLADDTFTVQDQVGSSIPARANAAFVVIGTSGTEQIIVYGGESSSGAVLGDMYTLTLTSGDQWGSWTQITPANSPGNRSQPYYVLDTRRIILWGGLDTNFNAIGGRDFYTIDFADTSPDWVIESTPDYYPSSSYGGWCHLEEVGQKAIFIAGGTPDGEFDSDSVTADLFRLRYNGNRAYDIYGEAEVDMEFASLVAYDFALNNSKLDIVLLTDTGSRETQPRASLVFTQLQELSQSGDAKFLMLEDMEMLVGSDQIPSVMEVPLEKRTLFTIQGILVEPPSDRAERHHGRERTKRGGDDPATPVNVRVSYSQFDANYTKNGFNLTRENTKFSLFVRGWPFDDEQSQLQLSAIVNLPENERVTDITGEVSGGFVRDIIRGNNGTTVVIERKTTAEQDQVASVSATASFFNTSNLVFIEYVFDHVSDLLVFDPSVAILLDDNGDGTGNSNNNNNPGDGNNEGGDGATDNDAVTIGISIGAASCFCICILVALIVVVVLFVLGLLSAVLVGAPVALFGGFQASRKVVNITAEDFEAPGSEEL